MKTGNKLTDKNMNDFFVDMALTTLLGLLKKQIPNDSAQRSKWKKAMLKVFRAIGETYKNDSDFQK